MNKIYNEDIKDKFLNSYDNEQTQKTLRHVFTKSYSEEYRLDKDLYDFSESEVAEVIKNANPHNVLTAKSISRFIKTYIDWSYDNGYRKSNFNPMEGLLDSYFEGLVDKTKKIHYSMQEFIDLLSNMANGQDQGFLALIFSGVMGKSFKQLRELKVSDVNFNTNEVYVKERDTYIKIDDQLMKFIEAAINQTNYYTYNSKTHEHNEKPLVESGEYVFKNVQSPRTSAGMVNPSVFYTRLNNLKEEYELDYLTPQAIKQSGIIYQCYLLYQEFDKLEYEEFAKLEKNYELPTVNSSSGYTYLNTTLIKEYVNSDSMKELYNIDIKF